MTPDLQRVVDGALKAAKRQSYQRCGMCFGTGRIPIRYGLRICLECEGHGVLDRRLAARAALTEPKP